MAATSPESATVSKDARNTSILVRFTPAPEVTTDQYDETISRMEKSGDWLPDGLAYHVAFKSNGNLRVSEIWDSREQFEAFGARLMPVLKNVGIGFCGRARAARDPQHHQALRPTDDEHRPSERRSRPLPGDAQDRLVGVEWLSWLCGPERRPTPNGIDAPSKAREMRD
jgi:hypothetical protein